MQSKVSSRCSRSSSGSTEKDPAFDLRFFVEAYTFPEGLMPRGCGGISFVCSSMILGKDVLMNLHADPSSNPLLYMPI